jgi:hypothetical protein
MATVPLHWILEERRTVRLVGRIIAPLAGNDMRDDCTMFVRQGLPVRESAALYASFLRIVRIRPYAASQDVFAVVGIAAQPLR